MITIRSAFIGTAIVAVFAVVVGVVAYRTTPSTFPTHQDAAGKRATTWEQKALAECERLSALADEGDTDGALRDSFEEQYGALEDRYSIDAPMADACPQIHQAVVSLVAPTTSEGTSPTSSNTPTPRARGTRHASASPDGMNDSTLSDAADKLALAYGYTFAGSPAGEGAMLAEITCERAVDGWDYETALADDISVGAPPDAAMGWNTFVYEEFCPTIG